MEKWATLEPVRLYGAASSTAASGARLLSRAFSANQPISRSAFIGPLPPDLHLLILSQLPLYDLPSCARTSRAFAKLIRDERLWERKWKALDVERFQFAEILSELDSEAVPARPSASLVVEDEDDLALFAIGGDDDFGDFATAEQSETTPATATFGNFVGSFNALAVENNSTVPYITAFPAQHTFRMRFMRAHKALSSLLPKLVSPPHLALSNLFSSLPDVGRQARTLHLLALFLSPAIEPTRIWLSQRNALLAAIDRFDANLLAAFEAADERRDEAGMKEAAWASWEVWNGTNDWELGKVWAEKRDVFYESDRWDPLRNLRNDILDLDPMVVFITHTLEALRSEGSIAVRVFPPAANILLNFADRIATEVLAEYISPLLDRAKAISKQVFLQANSATFSQAWRMVDVLLEVAQGPTKKPHSRRPSVAVEPAEPYPLTRTQAEDVIFRMFEPYMDEYLADEVETARNALDMICTDWETKVVSQGLHAAPNAPNFLGSQNPAQVKRNVLASFTDVLMLPVTVAATGGSAAAKSLSKLNPQQWGIGAKGRVEANGYRTPLGEKDNNGFFDMTLHDEDVGQDVEVLPVPPPPPLGAVSKTSLAPPASIPTSRSATPATRPITPAPSSFDRLELLLSLDVALELIHVDRDSLARVETFQAYPGTYGYRVKDAIDRLFVFLLQSMGDRHICPGFAKATEKMRTYKPAEHEETTSVAPLLQFFELVHIADTIQSMVQVFFDKELAPHIDRTDFLNPVIREKKRFENSLDDSVATGMNVGTEVLMNQVEHIIWTRTGAREYYPAEGSMMDLGPTTGCREAIACLEMHCKLLKGSTSKDVLEVFYQEVGIRLHAILQKHLKRQIVSLEGGFQVIADLNAYHAFIASLRVQQITNDFSNLKMLGHVFIVSDAKDLAQIVRDVTRYGGSFRPEDIYEFIQRRADWKKIEKTVDKTMYNLSFKEDCVIA